MGRKKGWPFGAIPCIPCIPCMHFVKMKKTTRSLAEVHRGSRRLGVRGAGGHHSAGNHDIPRAFRVTASPAAMNVQRRLRSAAAAHDQQALVQWVGGAVMSLLGRVTAGRVPPTPSRAALALTQLALPPSSPLRLPGVEVEGTGRGPPGIDRPQCLSISSFSNSHVESFNNHPSQIFSQRRSRRPSSEARFPPLTPTLVPGGTDDDLYIRCLPKVAGPYRTHPTHGDAPAELAHQVRRWLRAPTPLGRAHAHVGISHSQFGLLSSVLHVSGSPGEKLEQGPARPAVP